MARKQSRTAARTVRNGRVVAAAHGHAAIAGPSKNNNWAVTFSRMACETARLAGKPLTFMIAALAVVIWGVTGPLFNYSDTWQLVINTSTTIVTFLMVFLIQHTQNRDTLALQLKLAELIIAAQGAENKVAVAEDLSEEDLERMHDAYRARADETLADLNRRRGDVLKKAS